MGYAVDTVIIGGGPAGMSCACLLQKKGVSNLVVEKKQFPRKKLCAGLVTQKTFRLLAEELGFSADELAPIFCDESRTLELYNGSELLTRSELFTPFRLTRREAFDSFLAAQYQRRGGTLLENTVCNSIDLPANELTLSSGETVNFRHLVVADGALSDTRKLLDIPAPTLGFCVETHVPKAKLPHQGNAVQVRFGVIPKGYAWVFPSGNDFCVGMGGVCQKGIAYGELMNAFLSSLGLDDPAGFPAKGAFLPYGNTKKQTCGAENVILIGDAGGFADPISGEGLYFALASGKAAADAILRAPEKTRTAFCRLTANERKIIRQGTRLQRLLYFPALQKWFCKKVRGKNAFVGFYCENQVSEYKYPYAGLLRMCRDYKKRKKG